MYLPFPLPPSSMGREAKGQRVAFSVQGKVFQQGHQQQGEPTNQGPGPKNNNEANTFPQDCTLTWVRLLPACLLPAQKARSQRLK